MKIQVTILRDCAEADLCIYEPLVDVLRDRGHEISRVTHTGGYAFQPLCNFDVPCDLHLMGCHYVRPEGSAYRAAELPQAKKVIYYIFHDGHQTDIDCTNIQPIVSRGQADMTIQAPFGVRPHFAATCKDLPDTEKDIDILWCGLDWATPDGGTRYRWLDEFRSLLPPGVIFARHPRIFTMREYGALVKRSKICLSLWGLAEHCYRYWEGMWLGTCTVGQMFVRERTWQNINKILPCFVTPEEAAYVCNLYLKSGTWMETGPSQQDWYHTHYNEATYRAWAEETADRILEG